MNDPLKKRLMELIHGEGENPEEDLATINQAIESVADTQLLIVAALYKLKIKKYPPVKP